jgi:hypothetical protein
VCCSAQCEASRARTLVTMKMKPVALIVAVVWTAAVVGAIIQVGTWQGGVLLAFAGLVPPFIARRFFLAPDESISQSIQRELR